MIGAQAYGQDKAHQTDETLPSAGLRSLLL